MVGLLTLVQVVSYVDRFLPSLLAPAIKADLHLSDFQLGLLLGPAFALFYVVVGLPFGWAADRGSRRAILAFGVATWSAMTSAASLAFSFGPPVRRPAGRGPGRGGGGACAVSLIGDRFERSRRPRAMSLFMAGSFIGAGSAFLFGGPLVHLIEAAPPLIPGMRAWQSVFLVMGAPGLLLALCMFSFAEPLRTEITRTTAASVTGALGFIGRRWRAFGTLFAGSACVVTLGSLSLWNVSLFQRTWGWNVAQVGVATGLLFFTAGPLGTLTGIWLTQRWIGSGRSDATLRALTTGLVIAAPGFILFPWPRARPWGSAACSSPSPARPWRPRPGRLADLPCAGPDPVPGDGGLLSGHQPGGPDARAAAGGLADRPLGHPSMLRYAVSIEAASVCAPALVVLALGLKAFRRQAEALEREGVEAAR